MKLEIEMCIACIGKGKNEGKVNPGFTCPYSLEKCCFLEFSEDEKKQRIDAYNNLPKEMQDIIFEKLDNKIYGIVED